MGARIAYKLTRIPRKYLYVFCLYCDVLAGCHWVMRRRRDAMQNQNARKQLFLTLRSVELTSEATKVNRAKRPAQRSEA